jgi:DNA-binding NarL/FixJ family response regulator
MARILIIDDHTLYRESFSARLSAEMGFTVVGDAGNAAEGLAKARALKPDIVLMDIDMPGASPFEAMRRIRDELPQTKVIILSGLKGERHIKDAVASGAFGYQLKTEGFEQIKAAIDSVMAGRAHFHPEIAERLEVRGGLVALKDAARTLLDTLTPRERELFHVLAQGPGLKLAAAILKIKQKTADKHKANLMRRLNVHDRAELVHIAYREGLFAPLPAVALPDSGSETAAAPDPQSPPVPHDSLVE